MSNSEQQRGNSRSAFEWTAGVASIAGFVLTLILGWHNLVQMWSAFALRHRTLAGLAAMSVFGLFILLMMYILDTDESPHLPWYVPVLVFLIVVAGALFVLFR